MTSLSPISICSLCVKCQKVSESLVQITNIELPYIVKNKQLNGSPYHRPHLPPQSPTEKPGQFKLFLGNGPKDVTRIPRKFSEKPIYPVPRTRMIAPESHFPAMNRRLSIDSPTEKSMTPLEILARGTVPTMKPDMSIFGTPCP